MAKCFEPDLWLEIGLRAGIEDAEQARAARRLFAGGSEAAERFEALLRGGDPAGAKRFWAETDAAALALHDYRIDWLSAVLNQIYRRYGAEGLATAQLACANADWWHDRMVGDRQELRGCFEEPLAFPRVTEEIPGLNFGNPLYSTYRTHLAVFHFVMPIGEAEHPWPDIDCRGVAGRCWFTIYKDPRDTPASSYERAGLEKPVRA